MSVHAWRPAVAGITEVFHAHFVDHAWTLLIIDDGAVRYDLEHHEHGALVDSVTLLPPNVPHDGSSATPHGFRKRVLYLETSVLGEDLIGSAVDQPGLREAAEVAVAVGFYDQSHLTRHFKRYLGTSPARYARVAS